VESDRPHGDRENIDSYPEYPLFHIGRAHEGLAYYVAHERQNVQDYGGFDERVCG
jgi:hypothetical protein